MNLEKALDRFLPSGYSEPKNLHKAMRYSVFSGGKRIRPVILLEAAKACGGKESIALPLACAVEFIHTYSLIHDDLPAMDDDDYRRGKPSCHKAFGEATAILAGDALLTLAFEIIAKNCPAEIVREAAIRLAEASGSSGMVGGQEMDLAPGRDKDFSRINLLKTAKLFEVSAALGAVAARAGEIKTEAMADYGLNLGRAFQIADDIDDSSEDASGPCRGKEITAASNFIKKAKSAVKMFGKKADRLVAIADRIDAKISG